MAKTASVMSMKGGEGRTTLVGGLARALVSDPRARRRVLVVDLDPLATASRLFLGDARYEREVLRPGCPSRGALVEQPGTAVAVAAAHVPTGDNRWAQFDLLPSRPELAAAWTLPTDWATAFKEHLAKLGDQYDLVLIDCHAGWSALSTAAFHASDLVIVPATPRADAAEAYEWLATRFAKVESLVPKAGVAGVFNDASAVGGWDRMRLVKRKVRLKAATLGWLMLHSAVGHSRESTAMQGAATRARFERPSDQPLSGMLGVARELAEILALGCAVPA